MRHRCAGPTSCHGLALAMWQATAEAERVLALGEQALALLDGVPSEVAARITRARQRPS